MKRLRLILLILVFLAASVRADLEQEIRKEGIVVQDFPCMVNGKEHICLLVAYNGEPYLVAGVILGGKFETRFIFQQGKRVPIWQGVST